MIKHVVTFAWKDEVTDAEVAEVLAMLRSLPGKIPGLTDYVFGPGLGLTDGAGDFAIIATLPDAEALHAYLEHPEHVPVGQHLRGLAANRIAVQIAA